MLNSKEKEGRGSGYRGVREFRNGLASVREVVDGHDASLRDRVARRGATCEESSAAAAGVKAHDVGSAIRLVALLGTRPPSLLSPSNEMVAAVTCGVSHEQGSALITPRTRATRRHN